MFFHLIYSWNGPWKSITNPDNIALHVCAANHRQYHQAHITPFASEPLLSYFGYCGNKPGADALLAGQLPPSTILDSLLPETKQILTTLAQPGLTTPELPSSISTQEFKALYKILPEAISSSPSGRHLGHYKVASSCDPLAEFHAKMMSIPYLAGFSPQRRHQVVDIILEKNPGDPKIHRLRIIALQESDFNQSNRLLITRPLMHHLEDNTLIPSIMQYGSRPGRHCHSAILNKQLTFEIIRQTKATAAFIENDVIGCYDRMVNPILILYLWRLGTNAQIAESLALTWENTVHRIKTKYGVSTECYTNTDNDLLYGPGQGSTWGPFLWLLYFILIATSIKSTTPRLHHRSVNDTFINLHHLGDSFVDDTALGCIGTSNTDSTLTFTDS